MHSAPDAESPRPTLFLLHALGASARAWDAVIAQLGPDFDCRPIDLAGFGTRTDASDFTIEQMLDDLAQTIARTNPGPFMLVGHSMGGKLATLLTARAQAGAPGLSALSGVVLVAASPPSPEPIEEKRRTQMLNWVRNGPLDAAQAREFIAANTASRLPEPFRTTAEADAMRALPQAWRAWLERGAREDWSGALDMIGTPALILAGAQDTDLGETAQRTLNMVHYARAEFARIEQAAHLIPYEQPQTLAGHIARHWQTCARHALDAKTVRLIASRRVSKRTRRALLARRLPPPEHSERTLDPTRHAVLEALVAHVLPGVDGSADIASHIDAALAAGHGDGWRFATLPPDARAWQIGLDALRPLPAMSQNDGARLLESIADGNFAPPASSGWDQAQMALWFEDARAQIAQTWVASPHTMARIAYDGYATGGDGHRTSGYQLTGVNEVENWQITALTPTPAKAKTDMKTGEPA